MRRQDEQAMHRLTKIDRDQWRAMYWEQHRFRQVWKGFAIVGWFATFAACIRIALS